MTTKQSRMDNEKIVFSEGRNGGIWLAHSYSPLVVKLCNASGINPKTILQDARLILKALETLVNEKRLKA